ncbi:MAG: hypothetical protein HY077_12910 [Elusimicrobia bacterium]|nr:hypothetical protein [Elusimicrobiota bacterium]
MNNHWRLLAVVLPAGLAWAGEKFTAEQLKARFYYDLGPATLDVSSYPKRKQENYGVFARNCSQCHTLARPINAPIVKREDWRRYVRRMHLKTKAATGTDFSKTDGEEIVSFLAFDSKLRKVHGKAAFDAQTAQLKKLFEDVTAERSRRQQEQDQKKVKPAPMPGVGVKPQPH